MSLEALYLPIGLQKVGKTFQILQKSDTLLARILLNSELNT